MEGHRKGALKTASVWIRGVFFLALLPCSIFWWKPEGNLSLWAYDLLSVLNQYPSSSPIVLIEMDELSFSEFGQSPKDWNRALHADLLDRLTSDGAAAVVFDVVFPESESQPSSDAPFAAALLRNGRTILAAVRNQVVEAKNSWMQVVPPTSRFATNSAAIGLADFEAFFSDGVIRLHTGTAMDLAPLADAAFGVSRREPIEYPVAPRWMRHYLGVTSPFTRVSYHKAAKMSDGFYHGKIVIIGSTATVDFPMGRVDQFRLPIKLGSRGWMSGIELHATALTNLLERNWLRRLPLWSEIALQVFVALAFTLMIWRWTVARALVSGAALCLVILVMSIWAYLDQNIWIAWTFPIALQYPVMATLGLYLQYHQVSEQRDWLEAPLRGLEKDTILDGFDELPELELLKPAQPVSAPPGGVQIPEYDLLRLIGRGSYGDVWIASDRVGGLKAVKILRQISYTSAEPFHREFRGVKQFTPLSRQHPGLIQVLHVGLDSSGSCFHYVMELADDSGGRTPPQVNSYEADTLELRLRVSGSMSWRQCAELGRDLADATGFLHRHSLVHRDIKPSNIIFIGGKPKLADIGLVTAMDRSRHLMSQVGTTGFLPPEGCGSCRADVYALGRVLELTFKGPNEPHAPTKPREGERTCTPPEPGAAELLRIICKATDVDPHERYADGDELRDSLDALLVLGWLERGDAEAPAAIRPGPKSCETG